jgi:hypothetical protein
MRLGDLRHRFFTAQDASPTEARPASLLTDTLIRPIARHRPFNGFVPFTLDEGSNARSDVHDRSFLSPCPVEPDCATFPLFSFLSR